MKLAEWKFTFHLSGDHTAEEIAKYCGKLQRAFHSAELAAIRATAKIDHHIVVKAGR
jgi:hypothetical protein